MNESFVNSLWYQAAYARDIESGLRDANGDVVERTPEQIVPSDVAAAIRAWKDHRVSELGMSREEDREHRCAESRCNEKDELYTISEDYRVFGCIRSGLVHVCDGGAACPTSTFRDGARTCRITGLVVQRTFGTGEGGPSTGDGEDAPEQGGRSRRTSVHVKTASEVKSTFRSVLNDLLYDLAERKRVNAEKEQSRETARQAAMRYYKREYRKRVRPVLHEADATYHHAIEKPLPIDGSPEASARLVRYTAMLTALWDATSKSPGAESPRPGVQQFGMAGAYLMQDRLSAGKVPRVIHEADAYLGEMLPPRNDLDDMFPGRPPCRRYAKTDITRGQKYIKKALNAIEDEEVLRSLSERFSDTFREPSRTT
jgi:hypothetical protein